MSREKYRPRIKSRVTIPLMKRIGWFLLVAVAFGALALPAQTPAADVAPRAAAPAAKFWLIRIIPPRPTFDKDATPAEMALMGQHFAYWKDLNDKGICIFGGPVLDPRGVYGIIVVRASSQDEARALGDADPSVKAGVNKIEVAEFSVAFVPKPH